MPSKPKILLVDDEERFRRTTAKLLKVNGLDVFTVGSGREAIQEVGTRSYDVIILDVRMPGMSGTEALKEIKKINPAVEVIMLTGHASVDMAFEIMKLGAFDYLFKPCSIEELMDKIDRAYERKITREKTLPGAEPAPGPAGGGPAR